MKRLTEKQNGEYILPYDGENLLSISTLRNTIMFGDFKWVTTPNITYLSGKFINKLGELEGVLEKYKIKNLEEYISALNEARNFAIKERSAMFNKYIKETIKTEELETELAELKQKLTQYKNIEKEIGCDIEIFWKVYRRLSGHGKYDIHLYSIFNNEIVEIMPTEIISGTYSNYPQDCSFKYSVWDKICESYQETYSYFHFHDYNKEWFLSKEEAEQKLAEMRGKDE